MLNSQVHTTRELHNILLRIRAESESIDQGKRFYFTAEGEPVWPTTSYMVGAKSYIYSPSSQEHKDNLRYILKTYKDSEAAPEGYIKERVALRGWWVPDYKDVKLRNILQYSFERKPWGAPGFSYAALLTKTN